MNLLSLPKSIAKKVLYCGGNRWCPVCERSARKFRSFGAIAGGEREDAQCPWCNTLERHRLVVAFMREKTDLSDSGQKRLLHIAPEPCLEKILRNAAGPGYLSGDLLNDSAMEKMDITQIHHPENSFDVIYCSHVLEHVPDDRLAMREFYRVLKPGGWAILNVPVTAETTFEDPSIEDPAERERLFGQFDHVRKYGPDYQDRLTEAGFLVTRFEKQDFLSEAELVRLGLTKEHSGDVFYCTKQAKEST